MLSDKIRRSVAVETAESSSSSMQDAGLALPELDVFLGAKKMIRRYVVVTAVVTLDVILTVTLTVTVVR